MADKLATPQDLAKLLQLDYATLSATQQAALELLVEMATAKVQRAAGGQRIVEATDTALIDLPPGYASSYLELPQKPARSVAAVKIDGVVVTGYRLTAGRLWRALGWRSIASPESDFAYTPSAPPPVQVAVTYTHGYPVGSQALELARDAVLSLARLGYGNPGGAKTESVDDYRVEYGEADARMEMTEHMRRALAAEYGAGAHVSESR